MLFGTSCSKLGPSGRERPQSGGVHLRTEDIFGTKGSSRMEGSSGWRNATSGKLNATEALGWTLRGVNFSREALGSLDTCHHLDAGQILTTTNAPRFPTCRSLRKGGRKSKDTRMDYQCLKTHYDACGKRSARRISSDHCGSSRINCELYSWLSVVTSKG